MVNESKFDDVMEVNGRKDWSNDEFQEIDAYIKALYDAQSPKEKLDNVILGVCAEMENYLENENISEVKPVGYFLEAFMKAFKSFAGITQKRMAEHWDITAPNLRKYIKGDRSLGVELALKIATTFNTSAQLWLDVQSKNQLLEIEEYKDFKDRYAANKLFRA